MTRPLSRHFTHATGTDPSAGMLAAAAATTPAREYPNITYRSGRGESLPFVRDATVDMVTGAQCAHWFSYPAFWAEMARVVRPGGTVAFWGYKDFVFVGRRTASCVVARYTYGREHFGPYWTQPGRGRIQGRYRCLEPPEEHWEAVERWEYETVFPDAEDDDDRELSRLGYSRAVTADPEMSGTLVKEGQVLMEMKISLGRLEAYARTWSSVHAWKQAHPLRVARADGGSGDLVDEWFDELRRVEPEWDVAAWKDLVVDVELGHGVVCARRRGAGGE